MDLVKRYDNRDLEAYLAARRRTQIRADSSQIARTGFRSSPVATGPLFRVHYITMGTAFGGGSAPFPHVLAAGGVVSYGGGTYTAGYNNNCGSFSGASLPANISGWTGGLFIGNPTPFTAVQLSFSRTFPLSVANTKFPNPVTGPHVYSSTTTFFTQPNPLDGRALAPAVPLASTGNNLTVLPLIANPTEVASNQGGLWYYQTMTASGTVTFTAPGGWTAGGLAVNQVLSGDDNTLYWLGLFVIDSAQTTYNSPGTFDTVTVVNVS